MIIVKAVKYIFNSFVLVTLSDENHHRPPNEYKEYIMRIYTLLIVYILCVEKEVKFWNFICSDSMRRK